MTAPPLPPEQGLRQTAFRGALMMGGTTIAGKVITLGSGIALARLLEPEQFGLVALCSVVLNLVGLLAPLGLGFVLIRERGDVRTAARQVFILTQATGWGFYAAIVFGKSTLASILGNPAVADILPWLALMVPLRALTRVPEALIERDLGFTRMSRIGILHDLVNAVVGVGLAYSGFGVWSLVGGHLASAVLVAALNWLWTPTLAWLRASPWDGALMKRMLSQGLHMVGSASAYRFYMNVDNFLVGKFIGATALGYYSKAFSFTTNTVDGLHKTLTSVLLPSYAKIQDDRERLTRAYLRTLGMISAVMVPIALGIFAMTPILIPALYGMKWAPAIPIMQVLSFVSVVKPVSASVGSVFNALGYPQYNMRAGIVVAVIMVGGIAALIGFGMVGVAVAVVLANVAGYAYNIYQMRSVLPEAAGRMLPTAFPAFLGSLIMTAGMVIVRTLLPPVVTGIPAFLVLGAMGIVGLALYIGFFYLFHRAQLLELWSLVRRRPG